MMIAPMRTMSAAPSPAALARVPVLVGLMALGAAVVALGAPAAPSAGGGEIVFLSAGPPGLGSFSVQVMNGDGTGQRAVTAPQPHASNPIWLPRGRRIAFESVASPRGWLVYGGVWLVRPTGSGLKWVVRGVTRRPPEPAWSADGKRMVFIRNNTLYVAQRDGSGAHRLFRDRQVLRGPMWSPDGRRLAVSSGFPNGGGILVLEAGARHAKVLFRGQTPASTPSWSPDGRKIAFLRSNGRLFVMNADGTHSRRLTRSSVGAPGSWSPDGTRIAVDKVTRSGYGGVSVVDVRTRRARTISRSGFSPQWSPTGSNIAFATSGTEGGIYLVRPDGSHLRRLVPFVGLPRFSPGGARIAFAAEGSLFVVNADGTHLRRLTRPFDDSGAVGSPDHRKVAFVRTFPEDPITHEPSTQVVYVVDADRSDLRRIGFGNRVAWAPDGASVAFARGGDIYAAPIGVGAATQLTSGPEDDVAPAWSPDGATIAFTRSLAESTKDVCLVSPSPPGAATCLSADGGSPAWSPDGGTIAFTHGDRSSLEVRVGVIRPDGSGRRLLAQGYGPAWSPDGRRIAFVDVSQSQDGELSVVNLDGSGVARLPLVLPDLPSWSPDGTRIAVDVCPPQIYDCEIWSVAPDGSSSRPLTVNRVDDIAPVWWP
jgi:Tol biopolymer transport system component